MTDIPKPDFVAGARVKDYLYDTPYEVISSFYDLRACKWRYVCVDRDGELYFEYESNLVPYIKVDFPEVPTC